MRTQGKQQPSNETIQAFHRQLGKIFYGVAVADRMVAKQEVIKLKQVIRLKSFFKVENSDINNHQSINLIETVFDSLIEEKPDTEDFIADFQRFAEENPKLFDKLTMEQILATVYSISAAFAGYNKSELVFASRISIILNKIQSGKDHSTS